MTLIALILPGEGSLTDWWTDTFAPWFGTMRWLLPFFLLGGRLVARGVPASSRLGLGHDPARGLAIAYAGDPRPGADPLGHPACRAGGRIGRFLESGLDRC